MSDIIRQSFKINLKVLRIVGLYSPKEITMWFKVRAFIMYFLCTIVVTFLGAIFLIVTEDLTPTQITNNALVLSQMACQIPKFLPFVINAASVKRCISYFENPHFIPQKDSHKKIIDVCVFTCKRNSIILISLVMGCNIFWATRPLFSDQILPIDVWLPPNFILQSGTMSTCVIYIALVLGVCYTSTSCAAVDTILGGLVSLATGQLKILKDNLQNLNKYVDNSINEVSQRGTNLKIDREKICHDIIKSCIHHHHLILQFISDYEQCFSLALFGQFMGSIIVIGFSCLQFSKADPLTYNFLSVVTCFCYFMGEIYLYCYYGTTIFEESNSLTSAIYMGEWYKFDLRSRKKLIILMERSKKPITVTTGKILEMSVETFTTILKRSYSVLAVLKNQ